MSNAKNAVVDSYELTRTRIEALAKVDEEIQKIEDDAEYQKQTLRLKELKSEKKVLSEEIERTVLQNADFILVRGKQSFMTETGDYKLNYAKKFIPTFKGDLSRAGEIAKAFPGLMQVKISPTIAKAIEKQNAGAMLDYGIEYEEVETINIVAPKK